MKKLPVLALILVLAMAFTGCTSNELKLYDAFNKLQGVTSMESDTAFNFTLEGEGFSEEEQMKLQKATIMLNPLKLNIHQKTVKNKEKAVVKTSEDMNMNFSGMSMDIKLWIDTDMSGDKLKLVEIMKMPPIIMNSMFPGDKSKEYIVYDFSDMMGKNEDKVNFGEVIKSAKDIQPQITESVKNYQFKFDPGFEIAKYKEKRIIDGKELAIYEVKLDDAAFKNLVRYAGNYSLDDKNTIKFIKDYMDLVMKMLGAQIGEKQTSQDEINKEIKDIEKESNLKEKFNGFMDTYKDIKIIGDKGITLEYGVDSDGYIVHKAGSIPLRIDLMAVSKAKGNEAPAESGILKMNIDFNSKIYNINKPMQIDMPVVNESNSVNYMDMIMNTNR